MKTSSYRRSHRAGALFCLLALAFLYAPLAAAAWRAHASDCCKNGMCPARVHHANAASREAMPMDCGHDMSLTAACSLSCCHTADKAAVAPHIFILPQLGHLIAPSHTIAPALLTNISALLRFSTPPSPPPRISALNS